MTTRKPRVLLIAGPTASGKSALAMHVAQRLGGDIINADSMQVYRDLRVLTARPSAQDEAAVPHHLYGVLDAAHACSAAQWAVWAAAAIDGVWQRDRLPIVVGGTGLYFRALSEGLSQIPAIPGLNRAAARVLVEEMGPAQAHAYLRARDPQSAARIRPSDPQRIARALEVWAATGRGLAEWQATPARPAVDADFVRVVLTPDRAALTAGAEARLAAMVAEGALAEVATLMQRQLAADAPLLKAVGVAPLMAHARGDISLEQAMAQARTQTRRYIKRQLTWCRTQMIAWNAIETQEIETKYQEILCLLSIDG